MLYLEESFILPAKNDMPLITKLGRGTDSLLPKQGVTLPPALDYCPFLLYQFESFTKSEGSTFLGLAHIRIFDVPDEWYWRINPIFADILRLYPDGLNVWYEDPGGAVWQQAIALESNQDSDDGWKLLTRWIDVQLWRG